MKKAPAVKKLSKRLFYIQDTRTVCGNSASWWRPVGAGYTSDLDQAWKVTGDWKGRDTDVLRPCDLIDSLAQRHFDVQKLREIEGRKTA